ncbi:hypothetical protein BEH94_06070 [Candidatus Altiarchaeales archaeon WOR_SM1_SCG]|nr:hypothetical protein BEH94_06070 [Candidatus Altiarchaeales archaeon WOR_SM1_SCG]
MFFDNLSIQPDAAITLKINITITSNATEGLNINSVDVKGLRQDLCNENEYTLNAASDVEFISILQCTKPYNNIYVNNDTILCPEIYNLNIIINSSDVVLDCNGAVLDGGGSGHGIYLYNKNNVTIRNCIITNFGAGIYLENSDNNTVVNNTMMYNGLVVDDAGDPCQYFHPEPGALYIWTGVNGITVLGSDGNNISNNIINSNCDGIILLGSSNNYLLNNEVISNKINGISFWNNWDDSKISFNNTVVNNTANLNTWGMVFWGGGSNIIINNTANSNKGSTFSAGIYLSSSTNIVSNNTANSNHRGIHISYSSNNTIQENIISNNTIGIQSQNSNSTINSNIVCGNVNFDFDSPEWLSSSGDNNTCDKPDGWNDTGITGCLYKCVQEEFDCDLNQDGIIVKDYNDLMSAYKCFLGIKNCNKINYQNWNIMKQEYECFTNNK